LIALTAAETGHLVFATLQTQDAPQTVDRVIDVFPTNQQQQIRVQLAGALQGVVCQQLIPTADSNGRVVGVEIMMATPAIRNLIRDGKTHQIYSAMQAGGRHGMVIGIVSAMLIFIVPTFANLYASLGGILVLPTRMLMGASSILRRYFLVVVLVTGMLVWVFRRWKASRKGRYQWDRFKLKVKVFGPLFHKTALSRFSRTLATLATLATLIRSGVPILQALEIVGETVNNQVMSRAVGDVQESVGEGESLATPLSKPPSFPAMVVQMMAVGEETGALDTMLSKVADFYDQEVEAAVASLTSMIEPLLIAVMGAAVGGMVIALYLPLFNNINLVK
jgi:type II secretory pathway component PulF